MTEREKHEALLAVSPGYGEFVASRVRSREDDDDDQDITGFARWHLGPGERAEDYAGWDADRWLAEWNHWNS